MSRRDDQRLADILAATDAIAGVWAGELPVFWPPMVLVRLLVFL